MPELKPILSVFAFVFGAVFASFGGVLAFRIPRKQSIIKPGSYCPACGKSIKARDNIPILSWLFLGGKCRYCKAPIGVFSLMTEISGGAGFLSAFLMYGDGVRNLPVMISLMCLVFLFIVMSGIDRETHEVYDATLMIFALIAAALTAYRVCVLGGNILNHLGGAALGFGFFLSVALAAKHIMKRDALGGGDIWIAGIGGLLTGVLPFLIAVLLASLTGSVIELSKIRLKKQSRESEIPFVPYLLFGFGFAAIFGDALVKLYGEVMF